MPHSTEGSFVPPKKHTAAFVDVKTTLHNIIEVMKLVVNTVSRSQEGKHHISEWILLLTYHLHTIKAPFKPLRGQWVLLIRREATITTWNTEPD